MTSKNGIAGRSSGRFIHHGLIRLFIRVFWPTEIGGWPRISFRQHMHAVKVWRLFLASGQYFGQTALYQTFESMNLPGIRPTAARVQAYNLKEIISPEKYVLDVGCNMGALAVTVSPSAKHVTAIDVDESLMQIGSTLANYVEALNIDFVQTSIMDFETDTPFDVILCCAVFSWSGAPLKEFVSKISSLTAPNAMVLYESNNYDKVSVTFESEVAAFCDAGYSIVASGETSFETRRRFYWLKK